MRSPWPSPSAIDFGVAAAAIASFGGVTRRFDVRAELEGAGRSGRERGKIVLVDDYAHLPTEIAAVIDAARSSGDGWRRVVAVFQPNRFRRMALLSPEYRDAFTAADVTVITDIYPSGDAPIEGVTGKLVVDAILDAHPDQRVVWLPHRRRSRRLPRRRAPARRRLHLDGLWRRGDPAR